MRSRSAFGRNRQTVPLELHLRVNYKNKRMRREIGFLAGLVFLTISLSAADVATMQAAREKHHWFDLRDAVMAGDAPPLYRVIAAAAFHDVRGAEAAMKALLQSKPTTEDATDAHFAMFRM